MDRIGKTRPGICVLAGVLLVAGCDSADEPEATSVAPAAIGQDSDGHAHGAPGELGTVDFAVSCSPDAQAEFNRAAALLHSFWFAPAIEGFTKVAALDDSCAMAHWGVAMSKLGNPFAWPLTGPALTEGLAAVEAALAIGADTPREEAYVEAVSTFYRDAATVPHATRALAYAQAMGQLVDDFPDDTEGQIFYALSLDATAAPTDKTYANQKKAQGILERIAVAQPDHPGVAHYLIHSYDYPAGAADGVAAAKRYSAIAPGAPHALHMPSHIFTRLGEWDASISSNRVSAKMAKEELTAGHHQGAGSYNALHALDYLMYAYLQEGQDRAARDLLDEINAIEKLDVDVFAGAYAFAAIPARYAFERGQWKQAAKLKLHPAGLDWTRFPQAEAVNAFARGLGAARSGDVAAAAVEQERLGALKADMITAKQDYWAGQADIQSTVIAAWSALADGKDTEALKLMRDAADAEGATEKHPVMPGPLVPARELLGEMLLELKQPALALTEFKASQLVEPNRFRGLYGAARAAEMSGDKAAAKRYYAALVKLAKKAEGARPELAAARKYLA